MTGNAFEPTRLKLARQLQRLSAADLARIVGVSSQAVLNWEKGENTPSADAFSRLVLRLRKPPSYFYGRPVESIQEGQAAFRAPKTMSAAARDGALADGTLAVQIVSPDINRRFKLPACNVPTMDIDVMGSSPAIVAATVRKHWGLAAAPISNMLHLLEGKGVEVYWIQPDHAKVDAFSLWHDETPYIFLSTNCASGERQRFNLAHELGHLVMHRRNGMYEREADQEKTWSELEKEAHEFASEFMLPKEAFSREFPAYPGLPLFLPLKARWGISVQAMIVWGNRHKRIDDNRYQSLYVEISRRGWRKQEPDPRPMEESRLHSLICDRLDANGISLFEWADELGLAVEDIESIMPICRTRYVSSVPVARTKHTPSERNIHLRVVK